jgi:uncharacterized SAM-binding protein YcdF (DUF218 family)
MINLRNVSDKKSKDTDCFVVLSYAVKNKEVPVLPTKSLIEKVYCLRRKFPKSFVIMSTGDNQSIGITNASIMASYAKKIGIPDKFIIEEGKSMNTYENLIYSKKILDKNNFKHPTIIMLDLHERRTLAIAKNLGWKDFSWISVYSKGEPAYGWKWIQTYSRLTIFIYEMLAYVYCVLRRQIK